MTEQWEGQRRLRRWSGVSTLRRQQESLGVDDLWEQVEGVRRLLHPGLWSALDGRRDMLLKIVEDQDGWRQELNALLSRNGVVDE